MENVDSAEGKQQSCPPGGDENEVAALREASAVAEIVHDDEQGRGVEDAVSNEGAAEGIQTTEGEDGGTAGVTGGKGGSASSGEVAAEGDRVEGERGVGESGGAAGGRGGRRDEEVRGGPTPGLWDPARKRIEEDDSVDEWYRHRRHVFIFTQSGKPVFSRYGSEEKLVAFTGMLAALIAKFGTLFSEVDDDNNFAKAAAPSFRTRRPIAERSDSQTSESAEPSDDCLRYIVAGRHTFAFLQRGPLFYLCITSRAEHYRMLRRLLHRVHLQVVSILTRGIEKTLTARPNFDMRHLLGGTTAVVNHLVSWFSRDLFGLVDGFQTLPLSESARHIASSVIKDLTKTSASAVLPDDGSGQAANFEEIKRSIIGGVLLARSQVVALAVSKILPRFQGSDLICIINLVLSATSLRQSEVWSPICLPTFNDSGFLYSYINFLAPDVCIIFLSSDFEVSKFHLLSEHSRRCHAVLSNTNTLNAISHSLRSSPHPIQMETVYGDNPPVALSDESLVHFACHVPHRRRRPLPSYIQSSASSAASHYRAANAVAAGGARIANSITGTRGGEELCPEQYFSSAFSPSYAADESRIKRVFRLYHTAYDILEQAPIPAEICLEARHEKVFVALHEDVNFFLAFPSWIDVTAELVDPLFAYLRTNIASRVFMPVSPFIV